MDRDIAVALAMPHRDQSQSWLSLESALRAETGDHFKPLHISSKQ
uniref:Uncharacterized protein n=1 Tax=Rhizobium rhizogenes TaxID=359 RepID=A0A7S5DST4_RHIRH|nr:hypothetical protein pC5.7b_363 [Rhizobium rhizogenes]QCL09862.1 hypothetical protein pC5.8b_372 [Rhizobium rhizogenes]